MRNNRRGRGGGVIISQKIWCEGKILQAVAPKKKSWGGQKKIHADKSAEKKIVHRKNFTPPSGCLYFPLLNYHKAVMTEVFSLGTNQEAERLRPFGTGSVDQGAPFYSFPGRHFLSPVYRLALRGWLLISRRGLVSLFILWLLRPLLRFFRICQKGRKLHWSVDTMTSL